MRQKEKRPPKGGRKDKHETSRITRRHQRPDRGRLDDPIRGPGTGRRGYHIILAGLLGAGGSGRSAGREGIT